jgi:hypothetical protein
VLLLKSDLKRAPCVSSHAGCEAPERQGTRTEPDSLRPKLLPSMKGSSLLKYDKEKLHSHLPLGIIPNFSGVWFCHNMNFNQIDYTCSTEPSCKILVVFVTPL